MSSASPPEDAVPIRINGRKVDPQKVYARDAMHTNYIIIRAYEALSQKREAELKDLGVVIQEQVDQDTYLCYYEPSDLEPIRAKNEYIQQVDVYRNKCKIVSDLKARNIVVAEQNKQEETASYDTEPIPTSGTAAANAVSSICTVDILLHDNLADDVRDVASDLARKAGVEDNSLETAPSKIRMALDRGKLTSVASDDRVRAIEEVFQTVLHNNHARDIMCADIRVNDTSYLGEGQVIAVADTGFDKGSKDDCHPAFQGRVIELVPGPRGERPFTDAANDPIGHGTHVCGSIVGTNQKTQEGEVGGIAPKASIVVQSLYHSRAVGIKTPMDLTRLFQTPYDRHNARIHSNSWGETWVDGQRTYNSTAEEVDKFVWNYPDTIICFSAGNDNGDTRAAGQPAIGAQAAAKNCITVGATGSPRRQIGGKYNANPNEMYLDSSRGPTKEGRIKPDVVAPGVNILSPRTQDKNHQADIAFVNKDRKAQPGDPKWQDPQWDVRSGTSMATPLVAGCIAVMREVFEKQGVSDPPAALIKALLINGAVKLPGLSLSAQGFGRVHLQKSINMLKEGTIEGSRYFQSTGYKVNADFDIQ